MSLATACNRAVTNVPARLGKRTGSLERRPTQLLQPPAKFPDRQLVQPADRITLVKIELGRNPDPAGNSLDISGSRSRHSPASRFSVRAGRCQPPVVGTERKRMHGPTVLKRRADRQTGVGIPEPGRSVSASRRDDRSIAVKRQAIDRPWMRKRLADRSKRFRIPEPSSSILGCDRHRPASGL